MNMNFDRLFGFDIIQKETLRKYFTWRLDNLDALTVQTIREADIVDDTINVLRTSVVITVVIREPETIDNLTINFPSDEDTRVGDIIRVASLVTISNVTMTGSIILNPVTDMFPNDCVGFQKIEEDTWIRID